MLSNNRKMQIRKGKIGDIRLGLVLLLKICLMSQVSAQSSEYRLYVDSIKDLVREEPRDSQKIILLQHLGEKVLYNSHSEALEYFTQSKDLAENIGDTVSMVYSLIGMCDVYTLVSEYKKAVEYVVKAQRLTDENDYYLLSFVNSRLATIYTYMGNDSLSFVHDRKAMHYNLLNNDSIGVAYDLSNMATVWSDKENLDSAMHYYDLSFEYLIDTTDILYAYNYSGLGYVYAKKEEYKKALVCSRNALKVYREIESVYDASMELYFLGKYHYLSGNLDSALYYSSLSLQKNSFLNNHDIYIRNYELRHNTFDKKRDYKKTLKYAKLEQVYTDSINIKNKEGVINSIKAKYEFEEQQRKLEQTEINNKELVKQRTVFLLLSAGVFVFLTICVIVLILKHREHRKNAILVARLDRVNKSMRKLLSIIGHDLRDSVGNLKNFTQLMHYELVDNRSIEKMVRRFVPMVDSTYSLLDTLLAWTKSNGEYFNPQIEVLQSGDLVQLCVDQVSDLAKVKDIAIVTDVERVKFMADKNMILTVLRNLICNSVKFSESGGNIVVKVCFANGCVNFQVVDQGVGMGEDEIAMVLDEDVNYHSEGTEGERGSGVGLSLCKSFIERHGGKLSIDSKKGEGSTFSFIVPTENLRN